MKSLVINHIFSVLSQESFPVIGDSSSSLIFALLFTAFVLLIYLFIDHLPKPVKNKITAKTEPFYVKTMISLIIVAITSASWDFWWHKAVGRDNFWVAPHIPFVASAVGAVFLGFYIWRHTRDIVWKHIFFLLLLIPISGVFDNFVHAAWGFEELSKPIRFTWSPPHVLLNLAVTTALVLLIKILVRYRKTSDFSFFGNISFGAIFSTLLLLFLPFFPTGPWGQLAGFAGAGAIAFLYLIVVLSSERTMKGNIDATLTSIIIFAFISISYSKEQAHNIHLTPHDQFPLWLVAFSLIITGILLDITKNRFSMWVRGFFGGIVWSGILFGFATRFFAPQFQYGMTEIFTAITFSAIGGLVAGSIFGLFHLDDDKHIAALLKKW
jgi:hypothetical protein